MAGTFLLGRSSDDTSDSGAGAKGDDSFTSDDSGDSDNSSSSDTGDSGPSIVPSPKRRKTSGVYWW
jgi:hypothetical protein